MLLFALSEVRAHAQVMYGCTFATRQLITINTTTGVGTVVATIPGGFGSPVGIASRGASLYAAMSSGTLLEINPATAAIINTIPLGVPAGQEGDVVFRADGIGFLDLNGQFRFDITGPTFTALPAPFATFDGLAFNAAGALLGLNQGGDQLFTIDQTTGARTLIGSTGLNRGDDLGGLAFDAAGNLFAVLGPNGGPSDFFRIDPATGAATLIGPVGLNVVSGLTFNAPAPSAGVTVTQSGGTTAVAEGGAVDSYTVVLNSVPTANVSISLNPGAQLTVAPASLTFTPANWNVTQIVTVTAVDDALVEGPHTGTITHTATSADPNYNGVAIANVIATITDNDVGPLPPPPSGGGGNSEGNYQGSTGSGGGGEGTFGFGFGGMPAYRAPILHGPLADDSTFRVRNVSHQQHPADQAYADTGFGPLGWSLVLALGGGVILLGMKSGFA